MKENFLVSIVSLNYNTPQITEEFLDSINLQNYKNIEVILVDNGSTLKMNKSELERRYSWLFIIESFDNLGFTGGNNLAIQKARGEYVFIVNNDTIWEENLINNLLSPFLTNSKIGVVCPKILFYDKPDIIQYAGYTRINYFTGRNKTIGDRELDKGQHETPRTTFGAHGAAMMVSREVIEQVGLFYDPFFLYYEEMDWSYRIQNAGFEIFYQPKGIIYHRESSSVGKGSNLKTYQMTRNRILFMKRNSAKLEFMVFSLFYLFFILPKGFIQYGLSEKDFIKLNAFWKGTLAGFKMKAFE